MYKCKECGSIRVQEKAWVDLNTGVINSLCGDFEVWCDDCDCLVDVMDVIDGDPIDNFNLIKPLLSFNNDDEFYFVQVIQRKKDNPNGHYLGSNNSSRLIKGYYIDSLEKLEKYRPEMVKLAELFNARVGINLNKRSFYKTAFNNLQEITNRMLNKDFANMARTYNTACGIHNAIDDKVWLLDFDYKPTSPDWSIELKGELYAMQPIGKDKVLTMLPTRSGIHVITCPFDTRSFKEKFPDVEIHKNNPVNLYIPQWNKE